MSRIAVWLWDAGRYCGVTDDRVRAMAYAEAHLSDHGTVLVERAAVTLNVHGWTQHVRTGRRYAARLVGGRARWSEEVQAEPGAS